MIGSLGTVVFEVSSNTVKTFDNLKRDGSARWAKHDVHKIKPVSEFLGVDLDKISFTIQLKASLGVNPRQEIDTLREYRDQGKAVPLLIGEKPIGTGLYTIQSLSEDWKTIDNRGLLIAADINIELLEYVETVERPVVKKKVASLSKKKTATTDKKKSSSKVPKKKTKAITTANYRKIQEKQLAQLKNMKKGTS